MLPLTEISLHSNQLPLSIMTTVNHSYSALPNKLFSSIVCYFLSQISLFLLIFSISSAAPMVQYGSLLQVSSHFAMESYCISDIFALNRCCPDFLFSIALLLKNSLKPNYGALCLRVSFSLPLIRCVPLSLAQEIWVCSCRKSSSSPGPDTKRLHRKTVPTNRIQVRWILEVKHKHPKDCRLSQFF